jgi:hypothetical protein
LVLEGALLLLAALLDEEAVVDDDAVAALELLGAMAAGAELLEDFIALSSFALSLPDILELLASCCCFINRRREFPLLSIVDSLPGAFFLIKR